MYVYESIFFLYLEIQSELFFVLKHYVVVRVLQVHPVVVPFICDLKSVPERVKVRCCYCSSFMIWSAKEITRKCFMKYDKRVDSVKSPNALWINNLLQWGMNQKKNVDFLFVCSIVNHVHCIIWPTLLSSFKFTVNFIHKLCMN